jgi:dihydroxyacetone kinase phosphotransfer subunit
MIGLLIVSHSRQIAEGVKELAAQMTGGDVPIVAVGGTSDGALGTDAAAIRTGADQLAAADGFVVLLDMGSAVLSTEMALEDVEQPYVISNAPLVEGALLAAVEASGDASLDQVAAAAEQARELQKIQ